MLSATGRRFLTFGLVLLLATLTNGSAQEQQSASPLRVVVKITSSFANEVEAALPLDTLKLANGHAADARVNAFLHAHSARTLAPLYPDIVRAKKLRGFSDAQFATAIQRRFPQRASRLHGRFKPPDISRTYVLEADSTAGVDLGQVLHGLRADANVEFAERDHVVRVRDLPYDPYFWSTGSWGQSYDDLWGIKKIGLPAAWNINAGDETVVAVVDTGIDYNHADIAANVWTNANEIPGNVVDDDGNGYVDDVRGWDFIGSSYSYPTQSNDPMDGFGHGTHVAGTIAAVGNNGIGVIGIAWRARVMAVKGLDNQGYGIDSTLAPAIIYAANNGADIISNSWAGQGSSQAIAEAIDYAYNLGAVIVAAAGNNNDDARNYYPANLPEVITVAASDPTDAKASFSNWGSKIDVAAPGVDILSLRAANTNMGTLVSPDYTRASGTSMATPHVSGTAALILSQHTDYSNEDVRQVLRVSTDPASGTYDLNFGYGRIDAANALAISSVLEAKIQAPVDGFVATTPTVISGVARGNGFASYTLEYGAGAMPSSWTLIQSGASPVSGGTLGIFDPTTLVSGLYTIRLTAYDAANHAFVDRIEVIARAISISYPPPPQVPTTAIVFKPGAAMTISGTAVGEGFQDFRLEWSTGINPAIGWTSSGITVASGGVAPVTNDVLGTWDTSAIAQAGYYTIRLTVDCASYTAQTSTLVYFEPSLISSSWPMWLDQAPDTIQSGIVPATDASGNARLTMVNPAYSNSSIPSRFWSLAPDGSLQTRFDLYYGSYFQPAAGDLDGIVGDEVIVAEAQSLRWFRADNTSTVVAANAAPTPSVNLQFAQLVMEDLDGDSELETIGLGAYWPNNVAYIFAWRRDGTQANSNFPIPIADQNSSLTFGTYGPRVLVGDINGDGKKEIVAIEGSSSSTFRPRLFANDGTPVAWAAPSYPGTPDKMVLADLDHNGKLETLLLWSSGSQKLLDVLQPDGTERPGWPVVLATVSTSYLAVGDLNRDGKEEIVVSNYSRLYVFNADGTPFSSVWPRVESNWNPFGPVVIADIDGDGYPEIVTTREQILAFSGPLLSATSPGFTSVGVTAASQLLQTPVGSDGTQAAPTVQTLITVQDSYTANYHAPQLLAFHRDNTIARCWDLLGANGNQPYYFNQLTVGDFNNDGMTDIAAVYTTIMGGGVNGALQEGVATVLKTGAPFNPAANDWPMFFQNRRNTAVRIYDGTPPSVSITSPADGSNVAGVVTVTANATDNIGVVGVQLRLDGTNLGTELTVAPYQFLWDTTTVTTGNHTLVAVARDAAGNVATSTAVTVSVPPPIIATVSPNALSFGTQLLNSTSAAQNATVGNTGSQPLTLGITVTGDFAQTNNCSVGLAAGASCSIAVTFTPMVRGRETGTLTINAPGTSPLLVNLSGTGQAMLATPSPSSLSFSGQMLHTTSAAQTVTYTNGGDLPLTISGIAITGDFAQTNNCAGSLAIGASCSISVTFTPTVRGTDTGTLSISGSAYASVSLSGTGQAMIASFSPTTLNFANQAVNTTSASQSVTVTNSGDVPFYINSWSWGAPFSPTNNCPFTIAVGSSCTFDVTFAPVQVGSYSSRLTIGGNFPGSPATINLSGVAVAPIAGFSTTSISFASQRVNTSSAAQNVTLTNSGTAPLSITGLSLIGDFSQSNNCGTSLTAGTNCIVSIVFTPTARGIRSGTLTLLSNTSGSAPSLALSGNGTAPIAGVSPSALTFGARAVNTTSAAQSVTLTNSGDATLNIASISITGDFAQTNNCGVVLAVNASCNINVTFRPTSAGARPGAVTIVGDSFGGSPQVSLSGTGLDYALSVSPAAVTVTAGQATSSTVTVSALGGSYGSSVSLACSGLPASTNCSFTPSSVTPGSTSANSTVKITTAKKAPAGSYTVTITGTSGALKHSTTVSLAVN